MNAATAFKTAILLVENRRFNSANVVSIAAQCRVGLVYLSLHQCIYVTFRSSAVAAVLANQSIAFKFAWNMLKFCPRRRPTRIPRKLEGDVLVSENVGDSERSKN